MVEKALIDGLLLIKEAETGDLTADVTDADPPWVDLSSKALTYNIVDTRANGSNRPHGANPRVRVSAGAVSGTINITCLRDSGGTPDPEATFEGIHKTHGRMQFAIQDDRSELVSGADIVPDPSAANPQYTSSAVINSIDYFGVADGNGNTAAVVSVTADLDRDFARRV